MSLSIVMPCYVHIAMSLSIVTSQWMAPVMSLPNFFVMPQWRIPSNVLTHYDLIKNTNGNKVIRLPQQPRLTNPGQ